MRKWFITSIVCLTAMLIFPSAGEAWLLDLKISCQDDSQRLVLGATSATTDGYDIGADTEAALLGSLKAYFDHPEWNRTSSYYWTDIRDISFPKEWVFYVVSSYVNYQITLKWDISDVPATLSLSLTDDFSGAVIDMRAQPSYFYTNPGTDVRTFRVNMSGSM